MKTNFPELTPAGKRPHTSEGHEIAPKDDLWYVEMNADGTAEILSVRVDRVYSPARIDVYLWNDDEDREPVDGRDFVPDTFVVSMYGLHHSYEEARRSAVEASLSHSANETLLDVALGWILSTDADSNFVKHVLTTFGRISTARNFRVSFPTFPRAAERGRSGLADQARELKAELERLAPVVALARRVAGTSSETARAIYAADLADALGDADAAAARLNAERKRNA